MDKDRISLFIKESDEWSQSIWNMISQSFFNVGCPNLACLEISAWSEWVDNWVDLDDAVWGEGSVHIRAECPVCSELFDHRDKATLEFGVS